MNHRFTAIDLFSGCGGLTTGLKHAGFSVIGAVEIDNKARETYSLNHPEVNFLGTDIREINIISLKRKLKIKKGDLDLLAGCPPCQGFSTLRTKNKNTHINDERNNLIDNFKDFITVFLPKTIMMENVAGLAKYDRFISFVNYIKKLGYDVIYQIQDVSLYGVPQRRKRLILIASRIGKAILAENKNIKKTTVRDAISSLPDSGLSGDELHDLPTKLSLKVSQIIASIPKNGGSRSSLPDHLQLLCHKKTNGFNDVYGRMKWDDLSPTITSGCTNPSKGRFIHPEYDRPISLREAALLQTFPLDYKFNTSHGKIAIALMLGNALPPKFIYEHAKTIMEEIKNANSRINKKNTKRF